MMKGIAVVLLSLNIIGSTVLSGPCFEEYEITAYSYAEGYGENYQTATGETPEPYYTVAVDPEVIPLGTELYIEGVGRVKAQDTGGAVKGKVIDLHIGYDDCNEWGRQTRKVYVMKGVEK